MAQNITMSSKGFQVHVAFFTKKNEAFMREVKAATQPIFEQTAKDVAEDAKRRAPVQTPPDDAVVLAESIVGKAYGKRAKTIGFRVTSKTKGSRKDSKYGYGAFVEFGTSRSPAQPYLYPAYQAQLKRLMARLWNIL